MLNRALLGAGYVLAGVVSLVWLALSQAQAAPQFPALTGRVVDEAGILSAESRRELTDMLAGDEQRSGRQVVVVTLKSLQGYPIEDYGYQLGRHWGIGQKGKDTGALLIVAPKEHDARIEVGYGLEGTLTDARSRIIIERYMLPSFRKDDYNGGILAGTKALLQTLGNKSLSAPADRQTDEDGSDHPSIGFIIFIILLILFFHGGRMFWPLLFLGGLGGGRGGRGGWGGGGFGGGSSGGGFSGGGGSFGGGGASGHW